MKKLTLSIIGFFITSVCYAQIGINIAEPRSTLDVVIRKADASTAEGIMLPRLTGDQIRGKDDRYGSDHVGTIIYATKAVTISSPKTQYITAPGLYYFDGRTWKHSSSEASANTSPNVTSLNSTNATHFGTLTEGYDSVGGYTDISYTGGNGAAYPEQTVNSTGVTGITITLAAGTLANGNGTLRYTY